MINRKTNDERFTIRHATIDDVSQMEAVQRICFPTLEADELLKHEHFANHIRIFPAGQLVITGGNKIIASSSTLRTSFPKTDHTFMEATDNLWITGTHIRNGDWLYQFDIGVLPEYRGLKLSKELYKAQQELVKSLSMKGQVTVGMAIGYSTYKDQYSILEYCEMVRSNQLPDPAITPQLKAGFQWVRPILNYVDDPTAGNCGVLMVWPVDDVHIEDYIP